MSVGFHHGPFADSYEKQANKQGYTLGGMADFVQDVGHGLICAHIHGCITDREYDKILQRFQEKMIVKNLIPLRRK